VNVDDRAGARAVAAHLVELGHRRFGAILAVVGAPPGAVDDPMTLALGHASRERVLGWTDALDAAGARAVYVASPRYEHDDFVRAARVLLDLPDRPTAVLCFSDAIAAAVLQEAADRGLRVPADLSVVGFDDNPLARRLRPALTTVRQDSRQKGRAAAAALTAVIAAGGSRHGDASHVLLPADLVVRDSTGPVPADAG
jgi:DNA-binding LacI/PurR family transcriptional regulator